MTTRESASDGAATGNVASDGAAQEGAAGAGAGSPPGASRDRFEGEIPPEGPLGPEQGVEAFLRAVERGESWYAALLEVVARWTAPAETVEGVPYRYLLAGEAFDWLRLAERLLQAADEALPGAVPEAERERLLFAGQAPVEQDEAGFARAIGPLKHRAHLNFQYGVVVEEALLLAAELDLQKGGALASARTADVEAYERVYGKPLAELLALYREETEAGIGERVNIAEWQAFTYWCSKYRFRTAEPARVASDTRKALALLSQMDRHRRRTARVRRAPEAPPEEGVIDLAGGRAEGQSARPPATSMWERGRRAAREVAADE